VTVTASVGPLAVTIDPDHGARLVSFVAHGEELISTEPVDGVPESISRGSYPMVPWAGRIGHGRLQTSDGTVQLPTHGDDHALHGLGRDAAWEQVGPLDFEVGLGDPWPVHGRAGLSYRLEETRLTCTLRWDGHGSGASLGFHPWFTRVLADGTAVELDVEPLEMVERGPDMLPTGRVVEPIAPPWDDCFRLARQPVLRWGDRLALHLGSDAPWWVVYTRPSHAVCVEPQTAPPDAFAHTRWHRWLHASSVTLTLDVEAPAGRPATVGRDS
jgi:aldose 1-epimerase